MRVEFKCILESSSKPPHIVSCLQKELSKTTWVSPSEDLPDDEPSVCDIQYEIIRREKSSCAASTHILKVNALEDDQYKVLNDALFHEHEENFVTLKDSFQISKINPIITSVRTARVDFFIYDAHIVYSMLPFISIHPPRPSVNLIRNALGKTLLEKFAAHKKARTTLPTLTDLIAYLDQPLPDDMKILVTQSEFDRFISNDVMEYYSKKQLETLLEVNENQSSFRILYEIVDKIIFGKPLWANPIENAYITFWDNNIRASIEFFFMEKMKTVNQFEIHEDLEGEEKFSASIEDPRAELENKLDWTYEATPYVLGYYAKGPSVTFVAMMRPLEMKGHPEIFDIINADQSSRVARLKNLERISNICWLFNHILSLWETVMKKSFFLLKIQSTNHENVVYLKPKGGYLIKEARKSFLNFPRDFLEKGVDKGFTKARC
ncbi:hypothetical protein G9A89_009159 [Geosiphon pyriformis]|nr:hypothetical protein G9A89_009159 [Geosiphon pyriformis]